MEGRDGGGARFLLLLPAVAIDEQRELQVS